ncbi:rhodanese-like domain-containing protein [Candidatus Methylacidithermus pantelleriae]|uniref:rhodanese-like domain-containing protein n=1 Tax=Candidatus Methylacidithermus pantelleriae TaxID=2744239 RepID=UPI00157DE7F4|nr:rhodanese-like domain-containing protein [Candidatus Methylacidithermus pantelleriae]
MEKAIQERFPHAKSLSSMELARWLEDSSRNPPVLVDLRSVEEYEVSHLRGAIRVSPRPQAWRLWRLPKDPGPIVAYDSVGWRSAAFVEELTRWGVEQAWYLKRGLFGWVNEGGKLVGKDGRPTRKVHPGDSYYGRLLAPDLRSIPLERLAPPIY